MPRTGATCFAIFVLLLLPAAAGAQPNARRAEQLAEEGISLYRQAAYEQAIAKFEESYRLVPDPTNVYNIGKCYERMNRFEEAIAAYRRYIVEAENAADRQEVEGRIRNLEGRPARITVTTSPPGATIYVDDTSGPPAGTTPKTLELGPGAHVITLRLEGYEQSSRPVQGGFGREASIDVSMSAIAPAGGNGEPRTVIIRDSQGNPRVVAVDEPKVLHLALTGGAATGTVGTEIDLGLSIVVGLRFGYGLQLTPKLFLDLSATGYFEPHEAGTESPHTVTALTTLLEPTIRLLLTNDAHLTIGGGVGAMNLLGLEKGDEFFVNPEATPSGALLTFLAFRGGAGLWYHLTPEFAGALAVHLDYSPAITGIDGDIVRYGGGLGAVYRF